MTDPAALVGLLRDAWGIDGEIAPLGGGGLNYAVSAGPRRYVLKLGGPATPPAVVGLEAMLTEIVAARADVVDVPRLVKTRAGAGESSLPDGSSGTARLWTWVPGEPWMSAGPPSPARRRALGRLVAALSSALEGIDAPAAHRTHDWDLARADVHRAKAALVSDRERRLLLEAAFQLYAAAAAPRLAALPHGVIHGDVNDENVLVDGDRIAGLIDFGDSLWNPIVCELAIAIAYALLHEPDRLAVGAEIVAAYETVRPLGHDERGVLFPLVVGRLAASVAIAAANRQIEPDRAALFVTEAGAWALLTGLMSIEPARAADALLGRPRQDVRDDDGVPARLARRDRHISRALSVAYRPDALPVVRGEAQFLFDDGGRPYLDLVNNVCHVGHCHPRVVAAGQAQMARLGTNTRYLYDALPAYAERLVETMPAGLEVVFFVNSGSEANELALRLATTCTGRRDVLVVDDAYHGNTTRLIAISPYKWRVPAGGGVAAPPGESAPPDWVHVAPLADPYRGAHRGDGPDVGAAYAADLQRVLDRARAPIAAFITESMWSCGGQVVPPPGYLEAAFRHVRAAGGVCIADEVQVGFGRAGTHFWAFEAHGVVPDIVVLGKPMGNGHPIGAVVTTREIARAFENGVEFFSTFGGNPVSCAIGLAVLDVIRDEGLMAHAREVGARLMEGLRALMARHPIIGDVRGAGLFVGIDLVRDRDTREPAGDEANALVRRLRRCGILLSTDGRHHNVLKIKPPMVVTADDVDMFVRVLDAGLSA